MEVVNHVLDHKITVGSVGVWTGKTQTMIVTDLHILEINNDKTTKDVNIDDCVLITFTDAANEMRN
ncbi:hypothetical protein QF028_002700 [Neobacillus sp. B4I6]|uniref:hypothetical protein n=1 Tax=Neobacillus sp. B4I6 TaxID=3373925 RepID=UPI003D215AB0